MFILVPLLVLWTIALVDIVRRPLSRQAKIAWILVVLLVPFIGTLLYFILRKPTEEELRLQRAATDEPRDADRWRGVGRSPRSTEVLALIR